MHARLRARHRQTNAVLLCYKTWRTTLVALRSSIARRPTPRAWPSAVSRAVRDGDAPRRRPAAADPRGRRGSSMLSPTTVSAGLAAARPVRHHPHRRPSGHDRGRADRRGAGATAGRWHASAGSTSTCPPASPTATCCPTWARARPADRRPARRAATSTTRCSPSCARCCAATGRMPPRSSPSSTAPWTRSTSSRARCCASATAWSSSTPASRRCWTCWRPAASDVVGVPLDDEGLTPARWRQPSPPRPPRSSCSHGPRTPPASP